MKLLVLSWMLILSTLVAAAEPQIPKRTVAQIQKLQSRCEWAVSIPLGGDSTAFLKRLEELAKTHPFSIAKIGEYWDAKATRDLSITLEHLGQKGARNAVDVSDEVHRQYGLYYLENHKAIREMVDRLTSLNFPAEVAEK